METDDVPGRSHSRRVIVGMAVIVAILVLSAAWSLSHSLLENRTPAERVLSRYIEYVNEGDAENAIDMTIYALMDQNAFEKETEALVELMEEKEEYRFDLVSVEEIAANNLSRHSLWLIGEAIGLLETKYHVEFEHSYDEMCGLRAELILREGGTSAIDMSGVFLLVKVGSTWYLIDGVN